MLLLLKTKCKHERVAVQLIFKCAVKMSSSSDEFLSKLDMEELKEAGGQSQDSIKCLQVGNANAPTRTFSIADYIKKDNVLPPTATGLHGKSGTDGEIGFGEWFEAQAISREPWFQAIPIPKLTLSQCKSLVLCCKGWTHLTQFAGLMLKFLTDGMDLESEEDISDAANLLEMLLKRIENEFNEEPVLTLSQRKDLFGIFDEIADMYVAGKAQLECTNIPVHLVQIYPQVLLRLVKESIKRKNAALLVPLCANFPNPWSSSTYFRQIMWHLSSDYAQYLKSVDSESGAVSANFALAMDFQSQLQTKLGARYFNVLPAELRTLYCFEKDVEAIAIEDKLIMDENLSLLNAALTDCKIDCRDELEYLSFLLDLFPGTSRILRAPDVLEKVKAKEFPYLCMFLRNREKLFRQNV